MYNYTDDNTVSFSTPEFDELIQVLQSESQILLDWFQDKCMQAKILSEYDQEIPQSLTADNPMTREEEPLNHHETPGRQIKQSNQLSEIKCKEVVKLLGVDKDYQLNFDQHISSLCK